MVEVLNLLPITSLANIGTVIANDWQTLPNSCYLPVTDEDSPVDVKMLAITVIVFGYSEVS